MVITKGISSLIIPFYIHNFDKNEGRQIFLPILKVMGACDGEEMPSSNLSIPKSFRLSLHLTGVNITISFIPHSGSLGAWLTFLLTNNFIVNGWILFTFER